MPAVAYLGGIALRQDRKAVIRDPAPGPAPYPHKELISRLRRRECELCETGTTVTHISHRLLHGDSSLCSWHNETPARSTGGSPSGKAHCRLHPVLIYWSHERDA